MRVGTVVVQGPGDDVGAVVRARVSVLAEVKLERLNLQQVSDKKRGRGVGGGKRERKKYRQEKGWGLCWVGGRTGRGMAELDACKIRSQKMTCDQVNMMMDTTQTQTQTS